MTGLNQLFQILIPPRVRIVEMPRRHMQRADPRPPPALGQIIHIRPHPIRIIEERPQPRRRKLRRHPQVRKRLHKIRKALIPNLPRTYRHPQHRSRARLHPSHQRRPGPALFGEHSPPRRNLVARHAHGFAPDHRQRFVMHVHQMDHRHRVRPCAESKARGQRRRPFQHQRCPAAHFPMPVQRIRRPRQRHENIRPARRTRHMPHRAQYPRPRPRQRAHNGERSATTRHRQHQQQTTS